MSEAKFWEKIRKGMGNRWEAERIENSLNAGTPDVAYSMRGMHGWIELKYLPKAETHIKIRHYTVEQKNWIRSHGQRGGHVFLLLGMGDLTLLYDWEGALLIGNAGFKVYIEASIMAWSGKINFPELANLISQ